MNHIVSGCVLIVKFATLRYNMNENLAIDYNFMPQTYPIKLYLKYLPNLILTSLSFVVNILIWLWLAFRIPPQSEQVFLHYNILFGVDFVGAWWNVYLLPLTGLFVFIVNFVIGWLLFNKDKFITIILQTVNLISQIFLLIVAALLVFLNV